MSSRGSTQGPSIIPSWRVTPPSPSPEHRHCTSAAKGVTFEGSEIPSRWPPMSRMQLFSAKADLELQRLADTTSFEKDFLREPARSDFPPDTDDLELQIALSQLLRAETASDFAGAVRDADDAARYACPEDVECVASAAAAASARRRAAQRAAAHQAHIVDVIQETVPTPPGSGECAMDVVGYVGVTGRQGDEHRD